MPPTFTLERYVRNNFNYLRRMVDRDALPYFNIFWTTPAEAAHDWPDFGDVMSRQYQAAVMARVMTGEGLPIERIWRDKILGYLDPATGLLVRPKTSFSEPVADPGDAGLTLYALATAYLDSGDATLEQALRSMADGVVDHLALPLDWLGGFMIKSLMVAGRALDHRRAIDRAGAKVQELLAPDGCFALHDRFPDKAHMHGSLRTLMGMADWAWHTGDGEVFHRVETLYDFVRSITTRFGFICEVYRRPGDIVACETCTLMDLMGIAVTMANHGHPEFWGDVERLARNHLVESQVTDTSWLAWDDARPDTAQFSWREIGPRITGAYAGWSSPNHILACKEHLHWGGEELRGKPRALQNCCGGSGTHAFFIAWKNAARIEGGRLWVHLHMDKALPEAEIRGFQPWQGRLTIRLSGACAVSVRLPDFTSGGEMRVTSSLGEVAPKVVGNYLDLGQRPAGDFLTVTYPLPITTEEISVGNPGFRPWRYRVTWKGDTVVRMEPLDNDAATAYSDFEQGQVEVFYGKDGPGPLYQREAYLTDVEPELASIGLDEGKLDHWYFK